MTNPYREDIEVWEALREGEEYTVSGFLEELNEPVLGGMALYPVKVSGVEGGFSSRFDIPTYDHDAEMVELRADAVETVLAELEAKAAKREEKGFLRMPSTPSPNAYLKALGQVRRYGDYTIHVRGGEDGEVVRFRL